MAPFLRRIPIACLALFLVASRLRAQEVSTGAADDASDSVAISTSDERDARLVKFEGSVYVHSADRPEGEFIEAEQGMPLDEGDLVRTGSDGSADIGVDGESLIEIRSSTDFVIKSLAKPQTEFYLGIGGFLAKIQTLLTGEKMSFTSDNAVAAVRGTELAAQADEGQPTSVGVFDEGHVAVTGPNGGPETMLTPGQETSVAPGKPPARPGVLKNLAGFRARMAAVRRGRDLLHRRWRPRGLRQRRLLRARLARRPGLRAAALKNIGAAQGRRKYALLNKRAAKGRAGKKAALNEKGRKRVEQAKKRQEAKKRKKKKKKEEK